MKFGRICDILSSKRGTSFPLVIAVTLAIVIVFCGISETIRLMILAQGVRDAVQSAVISTINDNYDNVYYGVREGYSGAYQIGASDFEESLDYGDVYGRLDQLLGLRRENGYHVRYAGDDVEFRLSGLSIDIDNMPLAPANPDNSKGLLADAVIRLEVPVSFGGKALPPMLFNLRVKAKYMPIF